MSDISTMIVDMLRGDEAAKLGLSSPAAPKDSMAENAASGAEALANPAYVLYKKEALANGEPVMSPAEFKNAQAGN